jgi:hypothetical protein
MCELCASMTPLDGVAAATIVVIAFHVQAVHTHRILQPWCPYCRGRRKWEDDGAPEPSPDPVTSGRLTV